MPNYDNIEGIIDYNPDMKNSCKLPSNEAIENTIERAKTIAIDKMKLLNIQLNTYNFLLKPIYEDKHNDHENCNDLDIATKKKDSDESDNNSDNEQTPYDLAMKHVEISLAETEIIESKQDDEVTQKILGIQGTKKYRLNDSSKNHFSMITDGLSLEVSKKNFLLGSL